MSPSVYQRLPHAIEGSGRSTRHSGTAWQLPNRPSATTDNTKYRSPSDAGACRLPSVNRWFGDYTPKWIISALATPYTEDLVCKLLLTGYSTCRNRIHNLDVCSRQVLAFYCTAWSLSCPLRRRSFSL